MFNPVGVVFLAAAILLGGAHIEGVYDLLKIFMLFLRRTTVPLLTLERGL